MKRNLKLAAFAIAAMFAMASCENEESQGTLPSSLDPTEKKSITIDNMGEIHNEVLQTLANKYSVQTRAVGDTFVLRNVADCVVLSANEVIYSGKYEVTEQDVEDATNSIQRFGNFSVINVDTTIYENLREQIHYEMRKWRIDPQVAGIMSDIINNPENMPSKERLLLAVEMFRDKPGGDLLEAFVNTCIASASYWPVTRNAASRRNIIADAIGGVLGCTCSGVMGVIWAAAFSYAYDKATDPIVVAPQRPDLDLHPTYPIDYPRVGFVEKN